MNKRLQMILFTAFVIAALCSYAVYKIVGVRFATNQQKAVRVVVAAADIKLGSVLHETDLSTVEMQGGVPKGAITDIKDAVGRGVISDLYQGEPILQSRLAAPGAGGGLASTIRPGMRACAIKVDEVVGVAGFVTPGMRVDVLISGNPPGSTDATAGPKVKTLLQNIEVLSAGTDIAKDGEGKPQQVPVVNLLVTPEQAEQLSLASSQTHIQLVLRNPLDTQIAQTTGTAVGSLYTGKDAAPPPARPRVVAAPAPHAAAAPASKIYLVQVYNGSKRSDQKFVDGEEKQ